MNYLGEWWKPRIGVVADSVMFQIPLYAPARISEKNVYEDCTEYESIDEYCDTYDYSPLTRDRLNHAVKEEDIDYLREILGDKHHAVITWFNHPLVGYGGYQKTFRMILSDF